MTREEAIDLLPCLICGDLPAQAATHLRAMLQEDPELRRLALELEESQELCQERLERQAPLAVHWPKEEGEEEAPKPRSWVKTAVIVSVVLLALMWGGALLLQALL